MKKPLLNQHSCNEIGITKSSGLDYKGVQCVCKAESKTLKIGTGCVGDGNAILVQSNKSAMLPYNNEQAVFVPKAYGICSENSNSMKSPNPNSGIYEADTSRTIDGNGGNPSCNQGGMAVVAIQGSMIGRDDKNGPNGDGVNEDVCFTINCTDKHAVAYCLDRASYNQGSNAQFDISVQEELSQTIVAKGPNAVAQPGSFYPQMKAESQCYREDGKANTIVNGTNPGFQNGIVEPTYTVRRLTPLECCRLQGFPDFWCADLETEDPTEEDIYFWSEVFETHRLINGTSTKPKSRNQIIKWLKDPNSDSAEYKMWGNAICVNCGSFVLAGIVLAKEGFPKQTT